MKTRDLSPDDLVRRAANRILAIGLALLVAVWAAFELRFLGGLLLLGSCLVAGAVLGFGLWARLNADQFTRPPQS